MPVTVAGVRALAEGMAAGEVWAATTTVDKFPGLEISFVGVRWPREQLSVTTIPDLGPFIVGRRTME